MIIGLPVLSELENDKHTLNFYFPYFTARHSRSQQTLLLSGRRH